MQLNFRIKPDLLKLTAAICVVYFLLFLILRVFLIGSLDADLGGVENNVVYSVCKLLYGQALYENPETNNFDITQYAPLYYYLHEVSARIFHLNPLDNLNSIYAVGRTLSLCFNLLSALLLLRLLKLDFRVNSNIAIIAVSTFFIHLTRIHFAARPDALFGLLFIAMIACFIFFFRLGAHQTLYLVVASLLAVVSIFVKQTGIQYLVLIPAFFLLTKDFKHFSISLLTLAGGTAAGFFLFNQIYPRYFILNTITGINNGVSVARVYDVFSHFFLKYQLLFVLGILLSVIYFFKRKEQELKFLGFINIGIFAFALVTSVKEGSWINYYNEFVLLSILMIAVELQLHFKKNNAENQLYSFISLFSASYIVVLLPNVILQKIFHEHYDHLKNTSAVFQEKKATAQWLKKNLSPGEYFLSFDNHINCMLANQVVVPNKDIVPTQSKFNYTIFNQNFNSGKIRFIVKPRNSSMTSFMGADFSSCKLAFSTKNDVVLQNKHVY